MEVELTSRGEEILTAPELEAGTTFCFKAGTHGHDEYGDCVYMRTDEHCYVDLEGGVQYEETGCFRKNAVFVVECEPIQFKAVQ